MMKRTGIETRRGGLAVGRRVMAVLRLAAKVVIAGRRRAVGRLGGAAAASLVLGALGGLTPVATDAAWASCVLASGVYTCSGATNNPAIIGNGLNVTLSGATGSEFSNIPNIDFPLGVVLNNQSGTLTFNAEAGSSVADTLGVLITNNSSVAATVTLSGHIVGGLNGFTYMSAATGGSATITQTAGVIEGTTEDISYNDAGSNSSSSTSVALVHSAANGGTIRFVQEADGIIRSPRPPFLSYFDGIVTEYDLQREDVTGSFSLSIAGKVFGAGVEGWGIYAKDGHTDIEVKSTGEVSGGLGSESAGIWLEGTGNSVTVDGSVTGVRYGLYAENAVTITIGATGSVETLFSEEAPNVVSAGISLAGSNNVLTVYGRIDSNHGNGLEYGGDTTGNILNIHDGAVIKNVAFNHSSGQTTNFNTGAYTLAVSGYDKLANTVNALGSAHNVIYALDGSGDGDIVLMNVTPPVAQASTMTGDFGRSVFGLTGEIVDLDIARPLYNPTEPLGYAKPASKPNPTNIQAAPAGQGNVFDAYGNLFWARALGGATVKDTTDSQIGSNSSQYGLVGGVDHQIGIWRLGVFGGGGEARTALKDGSGALKGDLGLLGAYARVTAGKTWLDATVQGGYLRATSERSINGGAETAKGDFNGWFTGAELAVSTRVDLGGAWSLTPTLKGRYSAAFYDAYAETGSSQNVSYDNHTAQSLEGRFETRLTYTALSTDGLATRYWLKGAASATERLGQSDFGATVSGIDFTVTELGDRTVYGGTVGIGFDAMVTKRASIFASVDGTIASDHSRSGVARGGVKIAF